MKPLQFSGRSFYRFLEAQQPLGWQIFKGFAIEKMVLQCPEVWCESYVSEYLELGL